MTKKKSNNWLTYVLVFIAAFTLFLGYGFYKREYNLKTITYDATEILFNEKINRLKMLPDTSKMLGDYLKNNKKNFTAVLYLDGSCSTCIETLGKWRDLFQKENLSYSKMIIIGFDNTYPQLSYVRSQMPEIKAPFFIDTQKEFGRYNKISDEGDDRYMLVDNQFHIVTAGNPFKDKEILNTYLHYLKK